MIRHEIRDTMEHVRESISGLDEDTECWDLMNQAHSALALAYELVDTVNRLRLKELMEETPNA